MTSLTSHELSPEHVSQSMVSTPTISIGIVAGGGTSGVTSRIANPVPPVVMMRLRFWDVHCVIWDWIAGIESGTIVKAVTIQVWGNSPKRSLRMGPDRSVDASFEAVSLTGRMLEFCN